MTRFVIAALLLSSSIQVRAEQVSKHLAEPAPCSQCDAKIIAALEATNRALTETNRELQRLIAAIPPAQPAPAAAPKSAVYIDSNGGGIVDNTNNQIDDPKKYCNILHYSDGILARKVGDRIMAVVCFD